VTETSLDILKTNKRVTNHTQTQKVLYPTERFTKKVFNGKLKGVTIRESDFGKEISLAVEDKTGEMNYLNMPLFDAKKNLASYAESLITVLPSLKVGNSYRFFSYNIKEEGQKYSKVGISVLPADLEAETVDKEAKLPKLSYTYTKDGVEVKGDIPAIIWEEDFDGSKTMNAKAKNKFLYDILMANLSEAPKQSTTQPTAQASTPKAETPKNSVPTASPAEAFEEVVKTEMPQEYDQLPF